MKPICVGLLAASAVAGIAAAQTVPERRSVVVLRGWSFGASGGWDDYKTSYGVGWDIPLDGPWGIRPTVGRVEHLFLDYIHVKYTLDVTYATIEARWRPLHTESGALGVLHAGVGIYSFRQVSVFSYSPYYEITKGTASPVGFTGGASLEYPVGQRLYLVADATYHGPGGKLPLDLLDVPSFGVISLGVAWRY